MTSARKWGGGVLELGPWLRILLFLNYRSIVNFFGWGGWGVIKLTIFCGCCKCMTPNATRIRQSLAVVVSLDTCCYLSSKKLNCFSFWLISQITKSIRSAFCTLLIQSFLKFPSIRRILGANPWSQQKFLDLEIVLEISKTLLIYVLNMLKLTFRYNARRYRQALSVLVSRDPYSYL